MSRSIYFMAALMATASVAHSAVFKLVYKDFFNSAIENDAKYDSIYPDGASPTLADQLPVGTRFEVVATFDSALPDVSHPSFSFPGLQYFTPLSATLTVYLPSGPKTYTLVQGYTSPYYNHAGEDPTAIHNTDVAIFDHSSPESGGASFGLGIMEDPWISGSGFISNFATGDKYLTFSSTNVEPIEFTGGNGTGYQPGPGTPTLCGEPVNGVITPCTTFYHEPIKLRGSDGNFYWLQLDHGSTSTSTAANAQYAPSAQNFSALNFVPVAPCRLTDTRLPPRSYLYARANHDLDVLNSGCNIPSTAQAYSINVTVVPRTGTLGYLTVFPTNPLPRPTASTMNSLDGRFKANADIVSAGDSGKVRFYATDDSDLVVDINGYFVPNSDPTALAFFPMAPCRILDTRTANGPLGGPFLTGGIQRNVPVSTSNCPIGTGLQAPQAYVLTYTVVPHTARFGYLTTWPNNSARPTVSTLNAATGTITANTAIVPTSDGSVNVFASDDADLVIDMYGYFGAPGTGGLSLYPLEPCRVSDSRLNGGVPLTAETVSFTQTACTVPLSAQAFLMNSTVVPPVGGSLGYLTVWPDGQGKPLASTLNARDGAITSNMSIVPSSNGVLDVFASDPTHVVLDAWGFFAP